MGLSATLKSLFQKIVKKYKVCTIFCNFISSFHLSNLFKAAHLVFLHSSLGQVSTEPFTREVANAGALHGRNPGDHPAGWTKERRGEGIPRTSHQCGKSPEYEEKEATGSASVSCVSLRGISCPCSRGADRQDRQEGHPLPPVWKRFQLSGVLLISGSQLMSPQGVLSSGGTEVGS